jgi:TP901 family phage tail tape measure protein/lambda family phage tail tape measure protein
MAMNLDAVLRLTAKTAGGTTVKDMATALQAVGSSSKLSAGEIGRWNVAINKANIESGKTVAGIKAHANALTALRERVEIGGKAYARLSREIDVANGKLQALNRTAGLGARGLLGEAASSVAMGGGLSGGAGVISAGIAATGPAGIAAAGALAATAGFVGSGARNGLELEAQARAVRTLTNDYGAMSGAIDALVRRQGYQISTAEATGQVYEILSSGFTKTDDVLKILEASTDGATGGFASIAQVVDGTTSVLNSYGKSADNARRVVDAMIQVQNDGKIKVGEFANQIGRLAPTAVAAGVSLEELLAGISALSIGGVKPEQAISGLQQAIVSIIRPTDQARDLAKSLGIEFSGQALQAKGLAGFLADVNEKTKGSTSAMSVLFSDVDGLRAVLRLTSDQLKTFNGHLDNQRSLTGQAGAAAKKAVDPVKQFSNAWKDLTVVFTKGLVPGITEALKGLTGMISVLTSPGMQSAMSNAGQLFGMLTPGGLGNIVGRGFGAAGTLYGPSRSPVSSAPGFGGFRVPGPFSGFSMNQGPFGGFSMTGGVRTDMKPLPRGFSPAVDAAALAVLEGGSGGGGGGSSTRGGKRESVGLVQLARAAGFSPQEAIVMAAIAQAESSGNARAFNGNAATGDKSYGLWQINMLGGMGPERRQSFGIRNNDQLFDPVTNAMAARRVYQSQGYKAWSVYRSGAYKKYLGRDMPVQGLTDDGLAGDFSSQRANAFDDAQQQARLRAEGMIAARERLVMADAELSVTREHDELLKNAAEYDRERSQRMMEYVKLLQNAKSTEEQQVLLQSQGLAIQASFEQYSQRVADIQEKIREEEERKTEEYLKQGEALADATDQAWEFARARQESTDVRGGFADGVSGYLDGIGTLKGAVTDLTANGFGGLENALTELVTTGKAGFKDLAASVLADSAKMILQQLVLANVLRMVQNLLGGGGGGGGPLGSIFGGALGGGLDASGVNFNPIAFTPGLTLNAKGNAFGSQGIISQPTLFRFANGGALRTGLMGEAGPEAIMPLRRGPGGQLGVMAGGSGTSVVVNVDAKGTKAEGDSNKANAVGRELGQFVEQKILEMKRPGGLLA